MRGARTREDLACTSHSLGITQAPCGAWALDSAVSVPTLSLRWSSKACRFPAAEANLTGQHHVIAVMGPFYRSREENSDKS